METPSTHLPRLERPWGRLVSIGLAALALAQAGCSYPKAVHTYEYLTKYDRMTGRFDPILSLVHMPQDAKFSSYDGMIIGHVSLGQHWVEDREKAQQYTTYFRCVAQKRLLRIHRFEVVALDPDFAQAQGDSSKLLLLEGKITKFDMGAGLARWLSFSLRIFNSGATDFQIEGRITDASTGDLVMEFADRRRHLGNTPWGPNPKTFNDDFVMKITIDQAAACLADFIDKAYDGLSPGEGPSEAAGEAAEDTTTE